jgi:hypothetical protein
MEMEYYRKGQICFPCGSKPMSKYHIVSVDKEGLALVGEGMIEHDMLVDLILLAAPVYDILEKETFICEVWV